ncbi:MAG TPA: maltose alpha-D-glucosyltransferase, partial [Flavisolibacter sp.]|nr:maltose alpha-D-glucosyltransferase [Flavisolibacter sp.]
MTDEKDSLLWYKDAIIYELHIKAFNDSNGDGVGDFQGLLSKLDYLQDLGVTAIWVLPFYPSPLKDDGYDIANYYEINPSYGTIEEFRLFLDEAHKRNLKVITELVINHTSDQHPWFQRARKAPKGSPERDFYVWTDDSSAYKDVRIIFQDYESSNWTWDPEAGQYYWHRFFHHQPDLNYDNPLVQEEIFRILDFWCGMGVDGFRLDAVPYLYEREGTNGENLPETHAFLKKLRRHIDEKFPGTVFLAEANMWPEDAAAYFGEGDECHMNYHFPVMPRMFMAVQREDRYPITDIFDQTPAIPENCQWAMFLRNHDELTLEMVTDEERDYMYKVYAKDPKARINLGIRHRLAPLMENNRRKIELMNSLLFSMPGTPVIYYGDEIGMGDNFYLGDRDGVRTPMQWSPDRNAGFSAANPHKLYLPVILDPEYNYEAVNVETQRGNTSSLFWYMKRIIALRKKYKAFGRGDMKFIEVENPKVLAFTRTYKEETILVVVNLSKYAQATDLNVSDFKGYAPVELFSKNKFPAIKETGSYFFTLGPHSFHWFYLKPVKETLQENKDRPHLDLRTMDSVLGTSVREAFENEVIPGYLPTVNWFLGKQKKMESVVIRDQVSILMDDQKVELALIEVNYENGLPEWYQLPLVIVKKRAARELQEAYPQSILATVNQNGEEGLLCDAYYTANFQLWLFRQMASSQVLSFNRTVLHFSGKSLLKELSDEGAISSKVHATDQINTSINYNNKFLLKVYRKVDKGPNPDFELVKYLTEEVNYHHTPPYLGSFEWMRDNDAIVIGTMQELIENHGDGRTFMQERMNNYVERILAKEKEQWNPEERWGSFTQPLSLEELPEGIQDLLGATATEQARLLGLRTAEMHLSLATPTTNKDFSSEPFSLHYQRSLFSSLQSLTREAFESAGKQAGLLTGTLQKELESVIGNRSALLNRLRNVYGEKMDVIKIRTHDNFNLQQVLLTGKDIVIHNFGGHPSRNYSERRLKRSPLRDLASMIRSFYYAAYEGIVSNPHVAGDDMDRLLAFAGFWAYHISGIFMEGYLEKAKESPFLPGDPEAFKILL